VVLIKPLGEDFTLGKLRQRSNLFKSHWSNQWLTNFQLIDAARRREIDAVLVWRLDRWGRSLADLVTTLKELAELGVGFVSLTEALDMTTATGRAMVGLLAVFAQFEHDLLRERVRAGLAEARLKGKRLGRPATVSVHAVAVRKPLPRRSQQSRDRPPNESGADISTATPCRPFSREVTPTASPSPLTQPCRRLTAPTPGCSLEQHCYLEQRPPGISPRGCPASPRSWPRCSNVSGGFLAACSEFSSGLRLACR